MNATQKSSIVTSSVCDAFMVSGKSLADLYAFASLAASDLPVDSETPDSSNAPTSAPFCGATVPASF